MFTFMQKNIASVICVSLSLVLLALKEEVTQIYVIMHML